MALHPTKGRKQALVVKYERKHARTKSISKAVSLPQVLTASRAELGRPSSRTGPSRRSSRSRRPRRGAERAPPHRRSRASRRTRGPRARRSARAEPRACGGGARAARRRAPFPSARPAPPRARASAAGGRRGPARAGERARPGGVVQGRACACARGAGSARCVVHWCAPPTPYICDHQNACDGYHMQFDDKPSNFSGAHAATARHCVPHRARWRLRRHRRSLAALPAGRGPPLLLVPPPLPPRARRVEGASGAPAPPPASGPNRARRFFVRRSLAADAAGNFELCR